MDWPDAETPASPQVVGDAMRLPFMSASMDTVLATEVMEHLPDPDAFLHEIARVLRPGGCVLLSVPFIEPLHEQPRDFFRFTPFSLRLLLARHGFDVERISTRGGWWSVVLGSLVTQTIYDVANPPGVSGRRRNGVATAVALPLCAVTQLVAYALDRMLSSPRHTLGFVAVATRT
jgi:SAM-dependent methyltransferase